MIASNFRVNVMNNLYRVLVNYISVSIMCLTFCYKVYANECQGKPTPPIWLKSTFREIHDDSLLNKALGEPLNGGLCQGKVYVLNKSIRLYRVWNSTNPDSKLGNWWPFLPPKGAIKNYRKNYAICYQWSPLDKLISCKIKIGTKVVIGNGQSAKCSPYLTYPTSAVKQIFISTPSKNLSKCKTFIGVFRWQTSN